MTPPTPEQVMALLAHECGAAWLDAGHARDGWSVLVHSPAETCTDLRDWKAFARDATGAAPVGGPAPFQSGVLGYLGYGVGSTVEAVPPDGPAPEPAVWLARYEAAACFHHASKTWHLTGSQHARAQAAELLEQARVLAPPPAATGVPHPTDPDGYMRRVKRILDWIASGDCYQVNLSRAVHIDEVGDAFAAYRRLRARSQARFGAFLRPTPDTSILSNSPEELVVVEADHVRASPIKGTRPRGTTPQQDVRLARELLADDKERAELTMIVDLTRNDLGRIAAPGSVRVQPRTLTHHATVHHTHQAVHATLAEGLTAWDAVCALLPYGSITGAPKVRACQRIAELEPHPRGAYCGAIGYVADGGRAHWSVAIRTAVVHGRSARYHVGGGIVADSLPEAEWRETLSKGQALHDALCADSF